MHSWHDDARPLPAVERETPGAVRTLLAALLVPLAVTLLGIAPYAALPWLDGADRALVWVEGDAATLARVGSLIEAEQAFVGGLTEGVDDAVPDGCAAGAVRLHFDARRTDEAQVARVALEQLATGAGARVCASHRFELGRTDDPLGWTPFAAAVMLPLALLVGLRVASIERRDRRPLAVPVTMLALALATVAIAPPPPIAALYALPAAIASAMALALVHEVAFRGWLLARAAPVLGAPAAVALSIAASIVAGIAIDGVDHVAASAAIAAACSATWLRTGSTAACVAMHAIAAATLRVATG